MTQKAEATKEEVDKLGFLKIENFGVSKETIRKV